MGYTNSSLSAEVNSIINDGPKNVHAYYRCEITANGKVIPPLKIANLDIVGDYLNNFCDEVLLELFISQGTLEQDIIPYKENLEITIFRSPVRENKDEADHDEDIKLLKGRLVYTGKEHNFFSIPNSNISKDGRDLVGILKTSFQVLNPILESLRMQSTGGIFRNTKCIDLMRMLLKSNTNNNDNDSEFKVKGVDIIEGYNDTVKNHINLPMGINSLEAIDYINKNVEGIYPTGFGFYLKKDMWYIYPTYDTERFDKAKHTLTIIRIPQDTIPVIERSYLFKDKNLTIIVNSDVSLNDNSDIEQMNKGNGLRFTDANSIMDGFIKVDGNKAEASRGKNVSEFTSGNRETKMNNVRSPNGGISSNMYYEMSKLAKRGGSQLNVIWHFSDSTLLYPGMPVKFVTMQGKSIVVLYGVLLYAHDVIALEGSGVMAKYHKADTMLSIFVNRKFKWNTEEEKDEI